MSDEEQKGRIGTILPFPIAIVDASTYNFFSKTFPYLRCSWIQRNLGSTVHTLTGPREKIFVIVTITATGPERTLVVVWINPEVEDVIFEAKYIIYRFHEWLKEEQQQYKQDGSLMPPPKPERPPTPTNDDEWHISFDWYEKHEPKDPDGAMAQEYGYKKRTVQQKRSDLGRALFPQKGRRKSNKA